MSHLRGKYVIRPGDTVQVTKADVFVRCGYGIDIKELATKLLETAGGPISELVEKCGGPENVTTKLQRVRELKEKDSLFTITPESLTAQYYEVAIGMAKVIARHRKFGGNERKLYTTPLPEIFGLQFRVGARRVVYTGMRSPPYAGRYGEDEPEQGYLDGAKAHVLYELGYVVKKDVRTYTTVWIEKENVQKVL